MVPSVSISTQSPSSSLSETSPATFVCGNELFFLPKSFVMSPANPFNSNEGSSAISTLLPLDSDRWLRVTNPRIGVFIFSAIPLNCFMPLHHALLLN